MTERIVGMWLLRREGSAVLRSLADVGFYIS
jgi:hypothetical protein